VRRAGALAPIRRLSAGSALAAACALLAACVAPNAASGPALASWPSGPEGGKAPASRRAEIAVSHSKTSWSPAAASGGQLIPAALPGPQQATLTLDQLNGRTARELLALIGEPRLLRRDGPAQIWQYLGPGCVLHLFLYRKGGEFRVDYAQLRVDDPAEMSTPSCVEMRGTPQARSRAAPAADGSPLVSASARTHPD